MMLTTVRRTWAARGTIVSQCEERTHNHVLVIEPSDRTISFVRSGHVASIPRSKFYRNFCLSEVNMKRTLIALGLIAALLAAFGCQRRGGGDTSGGGGGDAIKVGVYLDLSGQTSSFGLSTRRGIEMARDEINNAGGINGRQIQLVVEDEQGEPGKVTTVVTKLLRQDQVKALLGEVASTNSLTAAPKAQEAHIPMITPSSTNPEVTKKGDYIFRVCFIDPFQGEVMAKFAANTLKARRAAILSDFNSDYSKGLTQFFKQSFTK